MSSIKEHSFQPGWVTDEGYRIIKPLGKPGDEGEVYHAKFKQILDRAVKFIDVERVNEGALRNEVALLSRVRHTHIIKIMEFAPTAGARDPQVSDQLPMFRTPYFLIAMDYVPGKEFQAVWIPSASC